MKRRKFLQQAGLFAGASLIPVGASGWVARSAAQSKNSPRAIVIFLRGAVDALNLVVPYREPIYYEARPNLAIPAPGEREGLIDLDGRFGLNPALSDVMPLWKRGSLAFIHACGSPDATRSHFDAQDYMETGTPGQKNTQDGWMNRLLAVLPKGTPVQALNVGSTTPRILQGKMTVTSISTGNSTTAIQPIDRPLVNAAFDRLYSGNDPISLTYKKGEQSRELVLKELSQEMVSSAKGAPSAVGFANDARKVARLMAGDTKTQLAFLALGGWDTHVNQTNQLNRYLKPLGEGLAVLEKELGSLYANTAIVVMSEFGRTVRENGNNGTDHGHGSVMWVLGGRIKGGKIYGNWPGLADEQLYEGRDLNITTDFREAIASVLTQHMKIPADKIAQVFPGYRMKNSLSLV